MPKLWYPEPVHVHVIVHRLAARLFSDYGDPLPAFVLMGKQGEGLLESALALPKQPYYRTIYDKAAVLLRSLIKNHPFVDGNKRAAIATVIIFLLFNNRLLIAAQDELVQYSLTIAESEPDIDWREISRWIRTRTVRIREPIGDTLELVQRANPGLDPRSLAERLRLMAGALMEMTGS